MHVLFHCGPIERDSSEHCMTVDLVLCCLIVQIRRCMRYLHFPPETAIISLVQVKGI